MLSSWSQLVNVGHVQGSTVILECLAMDLSLCVLELETVLSHFPNHSLQTNCFSDGSREADVLGLSGRQLRLPVFVSWTSM
jgi:hypothetical protein